jgi:hypothetical protein
LTIFAVLGGHRGAKSRAATFIYPNKFVNIKLYYFSKKEALSEAAQRAV